MAKELSHQTASRLWKVVDVNENGLLSRDAFQKSIEKLDSKLEEDKQTLEKILSHIDNDQKQIRLVDLVKSLDQISAEERLGTNTPTTEDEGGSEEADEEDDDSGLQLDVEEEKDVLRQLEERFKEFDEKSIGYLDRPKFASLLRDYFLSNSESNVTEEEVEKQIEDMWKELGKEQSSTITFKELTHLLMGEEATTRDLRTPRGSPQPLLAFRALSPDSKKDPTTKFWNLATPNRKSMSAKKDPRRESSTGKSFSYEPGERMDPNVKKLRAALKKFKKRNLTWIENDAVNEVCRVPSLQSLPLETLSPLIDQIVQKKKEDPEYGRRGSQFERRQSLDVQMQVKELTRSLTEKK